MSDEPLTIARMRGIVEIMRAAGQINEATSEIVAGILHDHVFGTIDGRVITKREAYREMDPATNNEMYRGHEASLTVIDEAAEVPAAMWNYLKDPPVTNVRNLAAQRAEAWEAYWAAETRADERVAMSRFLALGIIGKQEEAQSMANHDEVNALKAEREIQRVASNEYLDKLTAWNCELGARNENLRDEVDRLTREVGARFTIAEMDSLRAAKDGRIAAKDARIAELETMLAGRPEAPAPAPKPPAHDPFRVVEPDRRRLGI